MADKVSRRDWHRGPSKAQAPRDTWKPRMDGHKANRQRDIVHQLQGTILGSKPKAELFLIVLYVFNEVNLT